MKKLTLRQQEVLATIRKMTEQAGYSPTLRELGPALGIKSLRGVTCHLDALEAKGYLTRSKYNRSIRVIDHVKEES